MTASRSTSASAGISIGSGAAASSVRRRPSGVSPPNSALVSFDLPCDRAPLPLVARQQSAELRLLGGEPVELLADLDLLEPAQRAQPHVEDRLGLDFARAPSGPSSRLFGSSPSRMMRITSSRLR